MASSPPAATRRRPTPPPRSATPAGEVLYRFDPAGENPLVISPPIIADMNTMLNSVAENGTGKRALLPGIKVAGKTGTTNSYRDAWFMGFTGNLVAGVWYGNDDYKPTNKMTGGTLPAMTWQQVMAFAHQDLDIRPIPGRGAVRGGQARQQGGGDGQGRGRCRRRRRGAASPASCPAEPPRRRATSARCSTARRPRPTMTAPPRRSAARAAPCTTAGQPDRRRRQLQRRQVDFSLTARVSAPSRLDVDRRSRPPREQHPSGTQPCAPRRASSSR